MFKELRKLIKHSGIYTFGNFTSKILGILLIPVYTKVIDVNIFGIYAILEVTLQFMVGILHFGLPLAMLRWLNLEENKDRTGTILFSAFISTLGISIVVFILMMGFKSTISELMFNSTEYSTCLILVSLIVGANLLNNIGLTYLRSEEKSVLFVIISIIRFFTQLIITIYLVAFLRIGIIGIFWGQLGGSLICLLFLFPLLVRKFTLRIKIQEIKEMFAFGYPLTFAGISNKILNIGDRYILGYLTTWSIVGMYSLGYNFANLIDTMFIQSFRYAFLPLAWKKLKDDNVKRYYAKMLTYFVFFIFWVTLFISIFSKGIIHVFARDKSYWDAYTIVPIAVFAIAIKGIFTVVNMGLQIKKKTNYIAWIIASAAVINVMLNFILIPFF
ncbi:MAG: oligosaccharide flippase family protein, partial [bacterium]